VTPADGAHLFARFAYPPNELGYCGPGDASVLLRRGAGAEIDISRHARQFEGAWVYLDLLAAAAGIADPLDARVVEAYWIGNELLDVLDPDGLATQLRGRLPDQPGASWGPGRAHHCYHVFAVYPWLTMLTRHNAAATALHVLDQCRIRWGSVVSVGDGRVHVLARGLQWQGGRLGLGVATEQTAAVVTDGVSLLEDGGAYPGVAVGDTVAMHWDWVCDVLSADQAAALARETEHQLELANAALAASAAER
jgi:Family of unknown function (DUF6390)